jgi:hypothetical protein
MDVPIEKVIVAVHGIGDQTRFATLQQALSQFCQYHDSVAGVPLGNFHTIGGKSLVLTTDYPAELQKFAFAEVYWAGIAREFADAKYSLEDVAPWIRTIISRVRMQHVDARNLTAADQLMIEAVLGEMLQTISVLERLCFIADKLGIFSFDLKKILVDYVDDVQIVAEFRDQGEKISDCFEQRMEGVYLENPQAEIYLVAHSEGTVVALLGMLNVLCGPKPLTWIKNVRGFMTFGSPIDKHLILWPELFQAFVKPCALPEEPIEWRNYYDFGDPVGFELETAREKFNAPAWKGVFNFPADHDHGFARYPLPGKAHVDYWQDSSVFGHFIRNVVYKKERVAPKPDGRKYARPPASRIVSQVISWAGPYLGMLALLFCAVLVLYKASTGSVQPAAAGGVAQAVGAVQGEEKVRQIFSNVAAITCLLAGLTVLARIPRLTRVRGWRLFGFVFFFLSIVANRVFSCLPNALSGAGWRTCLVDATALGAFHFSIAGVAIVVALAAYFISRLKPAWGMQALLVPGGIGVAFVLVRYIIMQLHGASPEFHHLWQVFVAAAVFLYLWWLVALIFDLIFVWHRYIRYSGAGRFLRATGTPPQSRARTSP